MGFPQRNAEGPCAAAFLGAECKLQAGGFTCPRCKVRSGVQLPFAAASEVCCTAERLKSLGGTHYHEEPIVSCAHIPRICLLSIAVPRP